MKRLKRILAITLSVLILCGAVPSNIAGITLPNFSMTASAASNTLKYGDANGITRAEWLYDLTIVFDMITEEEYLPDNYFSDLEESHKYYNAIIKAVQYGVVDIPAGEELKPDEYVTRDFAASTLNFCLGYKPEEGEEYTFTDIDAVSSPDSAQIALNRNWFALMEGAFSPETLVTSAQVKTMLDDAAEVLEKQIVDTGYDNTYEFADDVIVLSEDVEASEDENGVVSITDCPESIAANDKFAVYYNGIPVVYTAQSVTVNDNVTVIETESVETEDAFTEVDAQGVIDSSAMEIVPAEDVEVSVDEGSGGISTFAIKKTKTLKAEKTIKSGGLTGKISVKIENPYIDYSTSSNGGYVTLNGETTVTYSISASLAQAAGLSKGFTLFTVNILGVGSFDITVMVDFSGTASGTVKGFLTAGVQVEKDVGIRAIRGFIQHESYTSVEAETKVSLRASLGVTKMPVISAYIYAEVGVKANFSKKTFADDKKPHECTHFAAYLFAEYGASASAKIGWVSYEDSITNKIYTESNSPMRVVNHYEDGNLVAKCTRGTSYSNFFTKFNSRWSGCGWISANGAYGLNAAGVAVPLYNYELNDQNEATITKYNGNAWSVNIPKQIDGYTVVGIGDSAFRDKGVGYVNIPDAVKTISWGAFMDCYNLKTVTIPNSLTTLGTWAFNGAAIESIYIPKALKNCSSYPVFGGCHNLKTVTFEEGITEIIDYLFYGCPGVEKITLPNTVTAIGEYAFKDCVNLKTISIPNTLTSLGTWAFNGTAIESIYVPKALKICSSYPVFGGCHNLKTVTFEEGITEIIPYLLKGCPGIEKTTIPDTVTEIGEMAFNECINLETVVIPDSVTKIDTWAFCESTSLKNVDLPRNLTYLGQQAFGCTAIESIVIPKTLQQVGYAAPFSSCSKLKTVTFEDGTTSIIDNILDSCTGLETVIIPKTVTSIKRSAFGNCVNLKTLTIPSSVTSIKQGAFSGCKSLESVSWTDNIVELGNSVFANCTNLRSITIPNALREVGYSLFYNSGLEAVEIPQNWNNIPESCFCNCDNLKEITIPKNICNIYSSAFNDCSSLEKIVFENNIKLEKIYSSAFAGTAIKQVVIPETVSTIGEAAFKNCTTLENVHIPRSTKTLGSSAFMGCESLKDVFIADYSITKIESNTFKDCPALESIVLPKGLTTIGSQAFMNDTSLVNVTIPESVTSIDSTAFSYPLKTTIYGKTGSYAETFANDGGFTFKDISIPVEGIIVKDGVENVTLDVGETYRAEFEVYPEDANDVITLTANNSNVTINGHDIYARYSGDTVITATSTSGLTYEFNLHIRSVKNITVVINPNKTTYVLGEEFDKTGMSVQVNYNDGSTCLVDDYTISGFDSSAEGENTITIKWVADNGSTYSTTLSLNIVDTRPKLTGIFVDTLPSKLNYELRERLDTTGMVVKGTYTDNSESVITDYTVSGYNALKNGMQTITISYNGFTTTFTVAVGQIAHEHTYDNDCDTDCNGCGDTRVTEHKYDNACDKTCNVCNDVRDVPNHVYDNDCDTVCNKCGITRVTEHKYTNACDKSCNVCGATRTVPAHKYSHSCDKTCNVCGATRSITHKYTNACDKSCNVCGTTRTVPAHKYSHSCDKTCNVCGATRSITHKYTNTCDTKCNVCGAARTITHSYKTTTTKATLTKNGSIVKKCSVCGKVASNTAIKYPKTFTLSATSYTYNGAVKKPTVTVKDSAGKTISSSNYTVTYASGRKNVGTYTVKVTMKGNYTGTKTLSFKINPINVSKCKLSLSTTAYTYDGKVKKPAVTVKTASGTKLTTSSYTVTYASGRKNVGTYKVTVKMKGNYTGTKTLTFKINPAKTTVSKVTPATKSLKVAITKKTTQVTGYQIQYSTSKSFSSLKTKTITSYKTTSTTLSSLKAKTTYYARVRTYKTVGGVKYYSGWSAVKSAKTK